MNSSRWSPLLKAYSQSLLGFIGFLRDHMPFPAGGVHTVLPEDEEIERKE
ncbi:MAG: hypothetical protein HQM09_22980 [Candidatus Riflebacteria bacterium]|nr:hypothetical protein [Candidatus Riflebacteria bacterium]